MIYDISIAIAPRARRTNATTYHTYNRVLSDRRYSPSILLTCRRDHPPRADRFGCERMIYRDRARAESTLRARDRAASTLRARAASTLRARAASTLRARAASTLSARERAKCGRAWKDGSVGLRSDSCPSSCRRNPVISKTTTAKDFDGSIGIRPTRVPEGIPPIKKARPLNSRIRFPYLY
jgi:hypothetical protein